MSAAINPHRPPLVAQLVAHALRTLPADVTRHPQSRVFRTAVAAMLPGTLAPTRGDVRHALAWLEKHTQEGAQT